jgi:hypothetical protein
MAYNNLHSTTVRAVIDDLPDSLENVESSLFADDSAIFKGGRNLPMLVKSVQQALDAISEWADTWGFKISTSKTVAVLFRRRTRSRVDSSRRGFKNREVGEISRSRVR